jgi:hypothetical protein
MIMPEQFHYQTIDLVKGHHGRDGIYIYNRWLSLLMLSVRFQSVIRYTRYNNRLVPPGYFGLLHNKTEITM